MKSKETMDSAARNGVCAIVEYNYKAKEADELTLIKGAIINSVKVQPGGWWEGTLASTGKTGMFPDNFVRVLDADDKSPVVLRDKSETKNRRFKAVYSYTQNNNDELTLAVGDIIEFLGEVEEGWWRGKLAGKIGVFPSNFVSALGSASPILANRRNSNNVNATNNGMNAARSGTSLNSSREDLVNSSTSTIAIGDKEAPSLPPKPVREQCKVIFAYKPTNEDELEIKDGDIITILSRDLPDKGWWKGELKGKVGVFPDNFVQLISPDASPVKDSNTTTPDRPITTTKLHINNNNNSNNHNNSSSTTNGKRVDSFGSRDSLNDSGIITGNVAAYRKSLESKFESNASVAARKSIETKSTAEIRKSLENLDDRKSTPPPVLTKKPIVPMKKSPTVGSVAGNIFSGLKQKVNKSDKLSHHDSLDGIGASKMHVNQVADNNEKGVSGERLRKDDTEFDQVERVPILPDMRAGRAKAPKRRLPSSNSVTSSDVLGTSFENGDAPASPGPLSADETSKSDEDVTKPKPWEKNRAPWMDELKASQMKKTSPGVETIQSKDDGKDDVSKSFNNGTTTVTGVNNSSSNNNSNSSSHRKSNDTNNFDSRNNSTEVIKKDNETIMTKSMSSLATKISISDSSTTVNVDENHQTAGVKGRPTSVTLRNVNMPPIVRLSKQTSEGSGNTITTSTATILSKNATIHHEHDPNVANNSTSAGTTTTVLSASVTSDNVCSRVVELELRVKNLEKLVQKQNVTIEELLKTLKDESDKHHKSSRGRPYKY